MHLAGIAVAYNANVTGAVVVMPGIFLNQLGGGLQLLLFFAFFRRKPVGLGGPFYINPFATLLFAIVAGNK